MSDRDPKLLEGLIVQSQSGFFTVETDHGLLVCQLRGRLKKGPRLGDIAAVGDRVQVSSHSPGQGMIEALLPRKHMLARMDPTPRGRVPADHRGKPRPGGVCIFLRSTLSRAWECWTASW